jgi:2-hydroxycyclohexanecarboxyl-CoA dehydrogenase
MSSDTALQGLFSLRGRRLIVTGAASGMGREFTRLAAGDGAQVAMLDLQERGLQETAELVSDPDSVRGFRADLTDWPQVERAVADAKAFLGGFDGVCNFVGWDTPGRFWEQPLELWHKLIAINLWGALHIARATVPSLIEQEHGALVFVSSDAGRVGSKGETIYATTKAGVIGLTKSMARELAPHGIRVNCLCPGPTNTPLFAAEREENPKLFEKMLRAIPLRRYGEPADQATAVAFLMSDAASYITGQVLSVSGGLTMAG